jgi:hypothetical protein
LYSRSRAADRNFGIQKASWWERGPLPSLLEG